MLFLQCDYGLFGFHFVYNQHKLSGSLVRFCLSPCQKLSSLPSLTWFSCFETMRLSTEFFSFFRASRFFLGLFIVRIDICCCSTVHESSVLTNASSFSTLSVHCISFRQSLTATPRSHSRIFDTISLMSLCTLFFFNYYLCLCVGTNHALFVVQLLL